MKKIIYLSAFLMSLAQVAFTQNVGIGVTNPSELLHVKDGNLYIQSGELQLDQNGSRIKRIGANLAVEAQANLRLDPGTNYSVSIHENGFEYARFRGPTRRFGMGTLDPQEKIDIDGGIKLGLAENANAGTIQWTGTDMLAHTGVSWKSLLIPSEVSDADGDTGIMLTEGSQDEITLKVDNKDIMKTTLFADGSHYFDWFSDPTAGAFEKIEHRFFMGTGTVPSGVIGSSTPGHIDVAGEDRVSIRGDFNSTNQVILHVGEVYSGHGVGITSGTYLDSPLRALFDVRGDIECDGAEINNGLVVNDGATINSGVTIGDVMNIIPMSEPSSAVNGDIYMDKGTCGDCGSVPHLRYFNGTTWITL